LAEVSHGLYLASATLALFGVLAHEVLGSPKVLAPLKRSGLPDEVVWLHHFSWRVGSVAVLTMIALFLLAVRRPEGLAFAAVATAMSAGFSAVGISLALFGDRALWRTPAPYAWTVVAVLGGLGLLLEAPSA